MAGRNQPAVPDDPDALHNFHFLKCAANTEHVRDPSGRLANPARPLAAKARSQGRRLQRLMSDLSSWISLGRWFGHRFGCG